MMSNLAIISKPTGRNQYYSTQTSNGYSAHTAFLQANKASVQYNPSIKVAAKCPHGFPGGACPICMGQTGGGGGASSVKKKQTGMSWNEAYYVWSSIKKSERLAMEDLKTTQMSREQSLIAQKLENTRLQNFLAALASNTATLTAKVQNMILQIAGMVANTPVARAVNNVANLLAPSFAKLIGVADKIAAVYGERFKAVAETIKSNMNKILEKLLQSAVISKLIAIFYEEKEYLEDLLRRKIKELKAKIIKLTSVMKAISDELAEEYGNRKYDTDDNYKVGEAND